MARLRLALLLFMAIVVAAALGLATNTPKSNAQTGYGAPQNLPDQTIEPISHSGSNTGLAVGVGAGIVILAGAGVFGYRRTHNQEHPYP